MMLASGNRYNRREPGWQGSLTDIVASPRHHGPVGLQHQRMAQSGGDCGNAGQPDGNRRLAGVVAAPRDYGAARFQSYTELRASGDHRNIVQICRWLDRTRGGATPRDDGSVAFDRERMLEAGGHGHDPAEPGWNPGLAGVIIAPRDNGTVGLEAHAVSRARRDRNDRTQARRHRSSA